MSVVRLEDTSDLTDPRGRGQLSETLTLIANKLKLLDGQMEKVLDADKIVRPVPIEAYPMAAGQVYTGEEGGEIGDITWRAVQETPAGTLPCDGAAVSRTTYSDLFAKISTTFGVGNGSTTFNVPNLQRRVMVGVGGSGTSTLANTVGSTGGAETVTLSLNEMPQHAHDMSSHTHNIAHTHGINFYQAGGAANDQPSRTANGQNPAEFDNTVSQSTSTSGGPSTANTQQQGGSQAHNNMQPSMVLAPYIRFRLGPTDTIQTLPISWGGVNAQWRLDTLKNVPVTGHTNLHQAITYAERPDAPARPGAVVRISAASGTQSGNSSENKIIGVLALPHSFRRWKPRALRIATKINMTGCAGGTSATITLRVSDPVSAGAYLANQYSRTISVSGSTIADTYYVDAEMSAEDLGRDWKPSYLLRFELLFSHPKTFTSASFDVGYMEVGWA